MGTRYEQGRRFEYKVTHWLEARGFTVVRSAGSKGASKVDLIAVKPGIGHHGVIGENCFCHSECLWIQCKRTGALPVDEWNTLRYWSQCAGAVPILAENPENGRGILFWQLNGLRIKYARELPRTLYSFREDGTVAL